VDAGVPLLQAVVRHAWASASALFQRRGQVPGSPV
jgi:hypothetical protein